MCCRQLRDMFGRGGNAQLDAIELGDAYALRVRSLRDLIEVYDDEVVALEREIHDRLRDDRGYQGDPSDQRDRSDHRRDLRRRDR